MNSTGSFGPWQLKCQLGLGGFGYVHLWHNVQTEQDVATKSLKENANLSKDEIAKLKERWEQERKWMNALDKPYIVRGLNNQIGVDFMAFLTERHEWRPLQPIVMEYCNGGDVRAQLQLIENINGLVEYDVREVLRALRHAVEFLHTQYRIEHRDLKPDNIVIHQEGSRKIYKLTDFGFARSITENTMLKSIVGTRNYVAPEVLDTAEYKNTVDYWSMGVIVYELISGNLPFIPHQQLFDIVTNIRKKSAKCIAITEGIEEKKYEFHEKIPAANRMCQVFLSNIENWLTIALDQNYHTRGTRPSPETKARQLTFYSDLDAILAQKILTVFVLPTYKFYSWEITADMTLLEFRELVRTATGIKDIFCIFPTGHPRPQLSHKAIDLYVEEWQHNRDGNNPPAMLYIAEINPASIANSSLKYTETEPQIPVGIKKYLNAKTELPIWLLKAFEQSTHFLLSNEQFHLEAFVVGLKEYALTMEHEIFQYDTDTNGKRLQQYFNALTDMHGRVEQFCMHIEAAKQSCAAQHAIFGDFFKESFDKADKFKRLIATLQGGKAKVNNRYKSSLRRAKEMAENSIFDQLKKKDVYKLLTFRRHLKTVQNVRINEKERLETCKKLIYECIGERKKTITNEHLKYAYSTISSVQLEFTKLKHVVELGFAELNSMMTTLAQSTMDFHVKMFDFYKGANGQCTTLSHDGVASLLVNGHSDTADSVNELMQHPVHPLIEDITGKMMKMEIDEELQPNNDVPTTIDE